jgi:hypothetical protein|tara:strand:+ start:5523 stop:5858 length:336 start_codon:yes stop_codon:yes gene_type:complete
MLYVHIGLCEGRHEITRDDGKPLTEFIFPQIVENPMDFISNFETAYGVFNELREMVGLEPLLEVKLYITGLTPCLTATLLAAEKAGVETLILMHYDRESGKYIPQNVSALL